MKNNILYFIIFLFPVFFTCTSQQEAKNINKESFELHEPSAFDSINLNVSLFSKSNNAEAGFPYSAIHLKAKDEYIIVGRIFGTYSSNGEYKSTAVVKIDNSGKKLKEILLGNNLDELNQIYQSPEGKIYLTGYADGFWVLELNDELEIIQDKKNKDIKNEGKLAFSNKGMHLITRNNNLKIYSIDPALNLKDSIEFHHPQENQGGYHGEPKCLITKDNQLILYGSATPFKLLDKNYYNYDVYIISVNPDNYKINWTKQLGNNTSYLTADAILEDGDSIFVAGMFRSNNKDSLDHFNVRLYQFDKKGSLLNTYTDITQTSDYVYAIGMVNKKVTIGGSYLKNDVYTVISKSLSNNKLVDNNFFNGLGIDQIRGIYNLENDKLLVLGEVGLSKSWKIVVTSNK